MDLMCCTRAEAATGGSGRGRGSGSKSRRRVHAGGMTGDRWVGGYVWYYALSFGAPPSYTATHDSVRYASHPVSTSPASPREAEDQRNACMPFNRRLHSLVVCAALVHLSDGFLTPLTASAQVRTG